MTALDEYRRALMDLDDPGSVPRREIRAPRPAGQHRARSGDGRRRHAQTVRSVPLIHAGPRPGRVARGVPGVLRRHRIPQAGKLASNSRWRVREEVALGLQRLGASDKQALLRRWI